MMNAYLNLLNEPNYDNLVAIGLTQVYAWIAPPIYGIVYVTLYDAWNGIGIDM